PNSGRLVLRGGYGIFYSRPSTNHIRVAIDSPPLYSNGRRATVLLEDPFFPLPPPDQFPTFVKGVALSQVVFDRGIHTAYFNQYNASVQYSLGKELLFEAAYVGSHGGNLIRNVRINQASLPSPEHRTINQVTGQTITT